VGLFTSEACVYYYTLDVVVNLNGGLIFRLFFVVFLRPGLAIPLSNSGSRESPGCEPYHTRRPKKSWALDRIIRKYPKGGKNFTNLGDIWRHLVVSEILPSIYFLSQQDRHLSQTSVVALGLKHNYGMWMMSNLLDLL